MNYEQFLDHVKTLKHRDPPEGKMSPSSLGQLDDCPGSVMAQKGLPNPWEEKAFLGTVKHELARLSLENKMNIPDVPEEVLEDVQGVVNQVAIWESLGWEVLALENYMENEIMAGTADLLMIKDSVLRVADFKFGNNPVSVDTLQLDGYALMAYDKFEYKTIIVNIIQPPLDTVSEREIDIGKSRQILRDIHFRCVVQPAGRTVSEEACRFCKACGTGRCPESTVSLIPLLPQFPVEPEKADEFMEQVLIAKKAVKKIEETFKTYLKNGGVSHRFEMTAGYDKREITSAEQTCLILDEKDNRFSEKFGAVCSVNVKKLEALCVDLGMCTAETAKDFLTGTIGDHIETKKVSGSLKAKKKLE